MKEKLILFVGCLLYVTMSAGQEVAEELIHETSTVAKMQQGLNTQAEKINSVEAAKAVGTGALAAFCFWSGWRVLWEGIPQTVLAEKGLLAKCWNALLCSGVMASLWGGGYLMSKQCQQSVKRIKQITPARLAFS